MSVSQKMSSKKRSLIGMLTPSSNTILEPVTTRMLHATPHISAHFGRFKVTEIALSASALQQFDNAAILRAAELLSHARCQVIAWNGTSSGWLGFEADERLCQEIEKTTGARACTSVLALNEALALTGAKRIGLVTPYIPAVQERVITTYRSGGIDVVAEVHLGLQDNFSFSEVAEDAIAKGVREVAASKPDAIVIFCTNLIGAPLAAPLEAELGIPVYDTIATVLWKALALCGEAPSQISGWGSLFDLPLPLAA